MVVLACFLRSVRKKLNNIFIYSSGIINELMRGRRGGKKGDDGFPHQITNSFHLWQSKKRRSGEWPTATPFPLFQHACTIPTPVRADSLLHFFVNSCYTYRTQLLFLSCFLPRVFLEIHTLVLLCVSNLLEKD